MSAAAWAFALANVTIAAGYLFITFAVAPHFVVRRVATRVGSLAFFATSAITHLELTRHTFASGEVILDSPYNWLMLGTQVVQAVAVWVFIGGLWAETRHEPADTPRVRDHDEPG